MKGEIIKITELKYTRSDGEPYYRVQFKMADGSFAQTDIVPSYRNFSHWKPFLRVGVRLKDLEFIGPGKINADCIPELVLNKRSIHYEARLDKNGKVKAMVMVEDSKAEEMVKAQRISLRQPKLPEIDWYELETKLTNRHLPRQSRRVRP